MHFWNFLEVPCQLLAQVTQPYIGPEANKIGSPKRVNRSIVALAIGNFRELEKEKVIRRYHSPAQLPQSVTIICLYCTINI